MARNRYDMDEVLEEKFDINQVKRLAKYVAPHKTKMLLALFLMLSSAFLSTFLLKFLQLEMDVYIPDKNITGIVGIVLLTAVICIYLVVCIRLKITLTMHVGQDVIHQLREDIFEKLQELPFSYYDERPHGKIQVRVVNYVNNLSDILSNGILQTITDLFNLLFIIGFMFYECPINIDLSVWTAVFVSVHCADQKRTASGMADTEQQTIESERIYLGKYQWYSCDTGICPGR